VLERLTVHGTVARFPEEVARRRASGKFYHRPPGGESWADVALRVRSALADIERVVGVERLLVMCHDAVVVLFRYACESLTETEALRIARDDPCRNASMTVLSRDDTDQPWRLTVYNDVTHLERAGVDVTDHPGLPDDPES
jgi:broad specificity phosphatase PhoE